MSRTPPPPPGIGIQPPDSEADGFDGHGPLGIGWRWWAIIAAITLTFIVAAIFAFDGEPAEARTVSAAAIVSQPDRYEGDRVVVSGQVDELLTDRAVALDSEGSADSLLLLIEPTALIKGYGVAAPMPASLPSGGAYQAGAELEATGTVRDFDRAALSDELGLVLNDELFGAWEGEPAVVVDQVGVTTPDRLEG